MEGGHTEQAPVHVQCICTDLERGWRLRRAEDLARRPHHTHTDLEGGWRLRRAEDLEFAVLASRPHHTGVRLQVEVLLTAHEELAIDHVIRRPHRRIDVALYDGSRYAHETVGRDGLLKHTRTCTETITSTLLSGNAYIHTHIAHNRSS